MGRDEEIEELKRKRTVAKGKFTRKANIFTTAQDDEAPIPVLHGIYEEIESAFKVVEGISENLIELLCQCKEESLMIEADQYVSVLEARKVKIKTDLEKAKSAQQIEIQQASLGTVPKKLTVKKLDPPIFSGDVRDFPNFKDDYERLVVPTFGQDPYVLRQCLSGEALQSVKGLENDYQEMFRRLEQKFGNHRKIVDLIVSDLKALKPLVDGDDKGLIKTVEVVERCYLDLKKMNLEAEMDSTNVLGLIERVLPLVQKREWVAIMDEEAVKNKNACKLDFKRLLDYLLTQKRRIEYMGSAVRSVHARSSMNSVANSEIHGTDTIHAMVKDMHINQINLERQLLTVTKALTDLTDNNKRYTNHSTDRPSYWCWFHETSTHDTPDCYHFRSLSDEDKVDMVKRKGLCYCCMSGQHLARECSRKEGCSIKVDNKVCGMRHHSLLHWARVNGLMYHTSKIVNDHRKSRVMLMVSSVYYNGIPLTTLWDSGSDITVITHSMARKLGLTGRDIQMTIIKVGNVVETCVSKEYTICLTDRTGKIWQVKAYGLDEITSDVWEVDTWKLSKILQVQPQLLIRPVGKVDMLIGSDCCQLLPKVVKTVENLQLLENQFGYCVRGSMSGGEQLNCSNACVTLNHVKVDVKDYDIDVTEVPSLKSSVDKVMGSDLYYDKETCDRKLDVIDDYTIKEIKELELIEQGLVYDEVKKFWVVKYPWIKDPINLPNNLSPAIHRLKATEKRLFKLGLEHSRLYKEQMNEMIVKGVARKLTKEELLSYTGPVHYLHHHEVIKPGSLSTPVRIVFDSSAIYHGHQLNSYWAKGPDMLNSLLGVLLRMRQEKIVVIGDISRMYHSIRLDERDQHTHRFIWRDMDVSKSPEHYALTRVTFGDRPSGIIATLALRHTASKYMEEYPDAAHMIMRNTYVDDMIQSVSCEKEAAKLIRDTECILSSGGFVVKHWVVSGSEVDCRGIKLLESDAEKVLGMSWDIKDDMFFYKVKINFSPKSKMVHSESNVSCSELEYKFPTFLTRRMVLSQIASIFDPLGLIIPFTLAAKLLMREMIRESEKGGWDDPISEDYRRKWMKFFKELYNLEDFRIRRTIKPKDAVGDPTLVIFSDGSKHAYGAVAYIRFLTLSGNYETVIIAAKNKITPARQITIPRIELCAAVLGCRLREKIQQELDWHFKSVYHLVDSAIVRDQIQKDSYKFKSYVGTRIAEIQGKSNIKEWWWIRSEDNPADMLTRPAEIQQMGGDSVWQNGPKFLKLPVEAWPVNQTSDIKLPDMIGQSLVCEINPVMNKEKMLPDLKFFDLNRFSSYTKLLKVTSRVLAAVKARSFLAIANNVGCQDMQEAEKLWIREVQREYSRDWPKRFERLGPAIDDGIITVGNRMRSWLQKNWNNDTYVILSPRHRFTYLYVSHLHRIDHAGVDTTIAKLQRKFWVPGIRRIVKSIKHKCVTCKKLSPVCEVQRMGELVEERLKPSPPFCHTACDIFGPFRIRDAVKRRTLGKAYGIIFNCLSTRSVYLDLLEGYDTQSFLMVFRRFVSVRGYPRSMYSDRGPQFVSAEKEIKQMFSELDLGSIHNFGRNQGMEWVFTKSSDAPWQNGISEALIKSVKRALSVAIGDSKLSFAGLQTVLFEVANLLNERPIGLKPGSDVNAGSYLCPNELLLGRASNHAPVGMWLEGENSKRMDFLNNIVTAFWRKWQRDFFPCLVVQQKWHTAKRNVRMGDLVLIQDNNAVRGVWRLAQVEEAQTGRDGLVRDVVVRYKHQQPGSRYKGTSDVKVKRSVHRLAVILPVEEQ